MKILLIDCVELSTTEIRAYTFVSVVLVRSLSLLLWRTVKTEKQDLLTVSSKYIFKEGFHELCNGTVFNHTQRQTGNYRYPLPLSANICQLMGVFQAIAVQRVKAAPVQKKRLQFKYPQQDSQYRDTEQFLIPMFNGSFQLYTNSFCSVKLCIGGPLNTSMNPFQSKNQARYFCFLTFDVFHCVA